MAKGTPDWWKRSEALISVDFTQLNDTPGSYAGQAGKGVKVTAAVDGLEFSDTKIDDHAARHEAGGADEIDLAGMTPGLHAARHESGGADEMDITGLTPPNHAARHEPGGADTMEVDAVVDTGSLRTLGAGAQQAAPGNRGKCKIGIFTRDSTIASGTQTINDVGFEPDCVEFLAVINNKPCQSTGFDDGAHHYCTSCDYVTVAGSWNSDQNESIYMRPVPGNIYAGHISTKNAAGFIITWGKVGLPTGTITVFYKATSY